MLFCSTHNEVRAFSLKDGRLAWTAENSLNYMKSADIFLAQGLVWTGLLNGHDPKTGKIVRTLEQKMQGPMSHDRCYRNRITEQYLINSKTGGSDFVRLDGKGEFPSPWVRATCGLGVLPANGLLYSSPYSCTCVSGTMLTSFNALYEEGRSAGKTVDLSPRTRLIKGPAFDAAGEDTAEPLQDDWPTYRNTNARSGVTDVGLRGEAGTGVASQTAVQSDGAHHCRRPGLPGCEGHAHAVRPLPGIREDCMVLRGGWQD